MDDGRGIAGGSRRAIIALVHVVIAGDAGAASDRYLIKFDCASMAVAICSVCENRIHAVPRA
jgi:hypothetical protein